jgi:hypothetical protein
MRLLIWVDPAIQWPSNYENIDPSVRIPNVSDKKPEQAACRRSADGVVTLKMRCGTVFFRFLFLVGRAGYRGRQAWMR